MPKVIGVYVNDADDALIRTASKLVGLGLASFCRSAAIREARNILDDKKLGVKNGEVKN